MSSHPFEQAMSNRRNLIHTIPTVAVHESSQLGGSKLFNIKNNQAINVNATTRYHDINPQTTPSSFSSSNFMDFRLPQHVHVLDKMTLYMTLANAHASNAYDSDLPTEFWVRRIEVRQKGEVLQTLESLDMYLRHSVFKNEEELVHQEARNGLDATTYQADATVLTVAAASSKTYSLDIESLITDCQLYMRGIQSEITVRIYLENIDNFSDDAERANITLSSAKLRLREQYYSPPDQARLDKKYAGDVDHRYCDAVIETRTETLTGSSNNKIITQNYDGELAAVTFVVVRDMSDIDQNSDAFVDCTNIHFEDQSGHNLNNGIVWSTKDLRDYVYPQYFENDMTTSGTNKHVFAFVHCLDPVSAVKKGINTGYVVLQRNHRVVINPASTLSSHTIDLVSYCYKHLRCSNGVLKVY